MTLINDNDRLLVERNSSLYYIPVSDMSTLQDTDLLMIQRGGTLYKMEAQYLNLAPAYFLVEFLVIAGGGDWGDYVPANNGTPGQGYGGGGGAGGYISSVTGELTGGGSNAINPNVLTTDGTYSVTVGAASSNTIFSGTDLVGLPFNYTALAGGAGGQTGGSAGGGFGAAVLGTPGQGSASAAGNLPESYCSQTRFACAGECKPAYTGGGGGAGGPGNGVNGGIGVQIIHHWNPYLLRWWRCITNSLLFRENEWHSRGWGRYLWRWRELCRTGTAGCCDSAVPWQSDSRQPGRWAGVFYLNRWER